MDGFKAYKYYMAIKLHFTSEKYNVFETRGHVKGSRDTFNSRNDRYIFEKIAQKHSEDKDIIQFFVSNFAYGSENAVYAGGEAEELYSEWKRRKQSISKVFIDDLTNILNYCDINKIDSKAVFVDSAGDPPELLNLFLKGKVTIESMRIIDDHYPFVDNWRENDTIRIMIGDELRRIKKLKGFVKYESAKVAKIFSHFKEELSL